MPDTSTAFPLFAAADGAGGEVCNQGMSLRQWYAGRALPALIGSNPEARAPWLAEQAFGIADAMLAFENDHAG